MKKLIFSLIAMAATATAASANPPGCATCGNGGGAVGYGGGYGGGHGGHGHFHKPDRFTGWFRGFHQPKPQQYPWYLYWPYNGQFMTPFPVGGGAPGTGGLVNPYFPAGQ